MKNNYIIGFAVMTLLFMGAFYGVNRIMDYRAERYADKAEQVENLKRTTDEVVSDLGDDAKVKVILADTESLTASKKIIEKREESIESKEVPEREYAPMTIKQIPEEERIPFSELPESRRYLNYQSVEIVTPQGTASAEEVKSAIELMNLH